MTIATTLLLHGDVSVADGVLALMALQADQHLAGRTTLEPGTAPLGSRYACYDTYRCADDRWIAVAAIEAKFWANLCRELALDGFAEKQYDDSAQEAIRSALSAAFAAKPRDEWVTLLAAADTCVAPVLTPEEAASDVAFRARGSVATAHDPAGDATLQLAPLLAGMVRRTTYDLPDYGRTDTDDVLARHGFAPDEIATLREQGAIA
jgi:alpha-methylacyl-CoA racemase